MDNTVLRELPRVFLGVDPASFDRAGLERQIAEARRQLLELLERRHTGTDSARVLPTEEMFTGLARQFPFAGFATMRFAANAFHLQVRHMPVEFYLGFQVDTLPNLARIYLTLPIYHYNLTLTHNALTFTNLSQSTGALVDILSRLPQTIASAGPVPSLRREDSAVAGSHPAASTTAATFTANQICTGSQNRFQDTLTNHAFRTAGDLPVFFRGVMLWLSSANIDDWHGHLLSQRIAAPHDGPLDEATLRLVIELFQETTRLGKRSLRDRQFAPEELPPAQAGLEAFLLLLARALPAVEAKLLTHVQGQAVASVPLLALWRALGVAQTTLRLSVNAAYRYEALGSILLVRQVAKALLYLHLTRWPCSYWKSPLLQALREDLLQMATNDYPNALVTHIAKGYGNPAFLLEDHQVLLQVLRNNFQATSPLLRFAERAFDFQ